MRILKNLGRAAAALALTAGLAMASSSSAQAAHGDVCSELSGTPSTGQNITACTFVYFPGSAAGSETALDIGPNATLATGCKITGWLELYINGQSGTFISPKVTRSCNDELFDGSSGFQYYQHWQGNTSATQARGRLCIDLYYNGSSHSGLQLCHVGPWIPR